MEFLFKNLNGLHSALFSIYILDYVQVMGMEDKGNVDLASFITTGH